MITDSIKNITKYDDIPEAAKRFILSLTSDISCGRHELGNNIYANVEEYKTKTIQAGKFESHKKYIDIQILLKGHENIFYTNTDNLSILIPYDNAKDIMFYSNSINEKPYLTLDGSNFAVFYPQDAHAPQIKFDLDSEKVLKVVVKIPI